MAKDLGTEELMKDSMQHCFYSEGHILSAVR